MERREAIEILWNYMGMHQIPEKSDMIVGFGCYNEDVARRAAQLYHEGLAPLILFTGGLGRNTSSMWSESEAERFARIAFNEGVPEQAILLENRSTNSGENLIFSKQLAEHLGLTVKKIIGVQKPYMERRLYAAFPVYWPEVEVTVTSWQQNFDEYVSGLGRWGRNEEQTVSMIVGDFQRISEYARLGYQVPQEIPQNAWDAFHTLVSMGYTEQMIHR